MGNRDFKFRWQGATVEVRVRNFNIQIRFTEHGDEAKWESVPFRYANDEQAKADIKEYFR